MTRAPAKTRKRKHPGGVLTGKRTGPRRYEPGELDDLSQLPGQFQALSRDVNAGFDMLANKILVGIDAIKIEAAADRAAAVADRERIAALEVSNRDTQQRLTALERPKETP